MGAVRNYSYVSKPQQVGKNLPMKDKLSGIIVEKAVEELKKARKSLGLSHQALAAKTGISRSGISFIENHKRTPTLLTCLKMAKALDVRLADILARVER